MAPSAPRIRPSDFASRSDLSEAASLPARAGRQLLYAGQRHDIGRDVCDNQARSSAITLPSFGSVPAPTSSTLPPSFVTARRLALSSL